ncbi:Anaphase-promoting complex subunit 1 [Maudiozyma exigua]|uniref:Anaphase-promoting complex subunit 1 n=1 Tax=Maudiozyma exigua TaxID=34358 RepID=A0A9P6WCF7_MAUEX|nr:Anaphase-promoting complex subunit 1 [Kazachstania exigua]
MNYAYQRFKSLNQQDVMSWLSLLLFNRTDINSVHSSQINEHENNPQPINYFKCYRVPNDTCFEDDGEIWMSPNKKVVELINGNTLMRRFQFDEPIINAGFARFENSKNHYLAIILPNNGHIYDLTSGDRTVVCFPFPIAAAFWYSKGIILERSTDQRLDTLEYAYKYITLTDPIGPFGLVSFANNQAEVLKSSKMVSFANSNYNNNFSVLYENDTNMIHIYYTKLLTNDNNNTSREEIATNNETHINNPTNNGNDGDKTINNTALRRIFSSKRRVTSMTNNSASTTLSALTNTKLGNNILPINGNTIDPLSQGQPSNDATSAANRIFSTHLSQEKQLLPETLENNSNNIMNTTLTSLHLDNNLILPNQKQEDMINKSILSKDISLVKVSSISLPNNISFQTINRFESLVCTPLRFNDQEALIFFDKENNFAKVWLIDMIPEVVKSSSFKLYGNTPDNMVKLSNFPNSLLYDDINSTPQFIYDMISTNIALGNNDIQGTLAIIYNQDNIVLYNPFIEIFSEIIIPVLQEFNPSRIKRDTIKSIFENNIFSKIRDVSLYPRSQLVKQCFVALSLIVSPDIFFCILSLWQYIMNKNSASINSLRADTSKEFETLSYIIYTLLDICIGSDEVTIDEQLKQSSVFQYLTSDRATSINIIPKIIMGFHLLREELYLNVFRKNDLSSLDNLLRESVQRMSWPRQWQEYYNILNMREDNMLKINEDTLFAHPLDEPPSIMKSLYSITEGSQIPLTKFISFSRLVDSTADVDRKISPRCYKTLHLYEVIHSPDFKTEYVLDILSELNITRREIETYPIGIAKPLKELLNAIESTISKPDTSLNFSLIHRPDLANSLSRMSKGINPLSRLKSPSTNKVFNNNLFADTRTKKERTSTVFEVLSDVIAISEGEDVTNTINQDGELHETLNLVAMRTTTKNKDLEMKQNSDLIFGNDQRFRDAVILVNNAVPQRVHFITTSTEYTTVLAKRKIFLQIISLRLATAGLGYGAIMYGTETPLSTQKWGIPEICRTVIFPNGSKLKITSEETSDIVSKWGNFHTGVASGLKISRNSPEITGSWIAFNKPTTLDASFGGFLFGLGLNGHLKNLEEWHIYNFLSPKITFVSVGLLLGLCASSRKSKDFKIIKVLSVHVVALLPPGSNDMNINVEVQIAGLIGVGLILQETQNKKISHALMGEFKSLIKVQGENRAVEEYRIAVGISIGLMNLGYGNKFNKLKETNVDYMDTQINKDQKWLGDNSNEFLSSFNENKLRDDALVSELFSILNANVEQEKNWIIENSQIGCIICLIFIFLKTNNSTAANSMRLIHKERSTVLRPDFYMYREWAYYMIMWREIDYSLEFLLDGIEEDSVVGDLNSDNLPIYYTIAGRVLSIGIRYASTNNLKVRNNLLTLIDTFLPFYQYAKGENNTFPKSVDFKLTIKGIGILVNTLIVSASMVMCATGDIEVLRRTKYLHEVVTGRFSDLYKQMPMNYTANNNNNDGMDNSVISTATNNDDDMETPYNNSNSVSEFQTDLDNEDVEILGEDGIEEHIRKKIREEIDNECHYGKYIASNTALGYLFLGSGQYALKTSTLESIAYIIMSTLPLYMEPYPFQELKHFWSLAVEPRCLVVKDAITNKAIHPVTIEVTVNAGERNKQGILFETSTLVTPCLLPDITTLVSIKVEKDNYYPLELEFGEDTNASDYFKDGTVIYIQPKHRTKKVYNSINDIQRGLQDKLELFEDTIKSNSMKPILDELSMEDENILEMKLRGNKTLSRSLNECDNFNYNMLCSDENNGDVADYLVEIWKKERENSK